MPSVTIYELKRLYPLPKETNNMKSEVIKLKSSYVAANVSENKFMLWNKEDLVKCVKLIENEEMRQCEDTGIILSNKSKSCEISAIVNTKELAK